eukprot:1187977-Amphidinium_carterae.1
MATLLKGGYARAYAGAARALYVQRDVPTPLGAPNRETTSDHQCHTKEKKKVTRASRPDISEFGQRSRTNDFWTQVPPTKKAKC